VTVAVKAAALVSIEKTAITQTTDEDETLLKKTENVQFYQFHEIACHLLEVYLKI
jgi:hypothetical protein